MEPLGQPLTVPDRNAWGWWKLKKWVCRVITTLIQRYGNPKYSGKQNKHFAEYFRDNTSKLLLGPIMNTMASKASGAFVTDDVFRMSLQYLSSAIELAPTFKLIKPHLGFVLFQVVFPTLCLSPEDIQLFEDDPTEFVRKINDPHVMI